MVEMAEMAEMVGIVGIVGTVGMARREPVAGAKGPVVQNASA